MTQLDLPIVHATRHWVVVDKPAGLLSVPGRGPDKADCAAARIAAMFPGAEGPMVVHRLDMDTSGLMVLGLTVDSQRRLSGQFEARTVSKRYVALVAGRPAEAAGAIDLPIRLDVDRRPMQIHDPVHGKPSLTRWRVLAHEPGRTRIEFEPITGRSHQLRVHAAHLLGLGCPILGDVLYGDPSSAPRLMLHASMLEFDDPERGARMRFDSPAPF